MLNMNQPQKHYAKGKKPLVKGHILYDTMYKKCPEQANPLGTASRSVVARGWGEEGMGNRGFFFPGVRENVLKCYNGYTICECSKNHWFMHFKKYRFYGVWIIAQ